MAVYNYTPYIFDNVCFFSATLTFVAKLFTILLGGGIKSWLLCMYRLIKDTGHSRQTNSVLTWCYHVS